MQTFEELETRARMVMADYIVGGNSSFGEAISTIISMGSVFGAEEATRHESFRCTTTHTDFGNLVREVAFESVNNLFTGTPLDTIVRDACLIGAAFSFQVVKARQD
jgi:hypothetical protein